jgi:hypothetical protein
MRMCTRCIPTSQTPPEATLLERLSEALFRFRLLADSGFLVYREHLFLNSEAGFGIPDEFPILGVYFYLPLIITPI